MIRMCKKKKVDLVLCKSTSRFARNTVDCLDHIRLLKSLGIGVIFEKENINTLTAQSEFILSLYSSFAQAESESISKNITLGNQMAFKEGKVRYNYKYLLGYKKGEDGKPVIIPEEAEVIQLIFKLYIDGGSTHTIAQELNNKKYPTRSKSGKWSAMLIKRILQNEKYIGDCLLQKTYTIDCISHKAVKNNGERPMYYVSDCHPAIIDKAMFNIVQQEIARRNEKRSVCTNTVTEQGRYNSKYALTDRKAVQTPIFLKTVDFFSDIEYNRSNKSAKEERQWEYTLILTIWIFRWHLIQKYMLIKVNSLSKLMLRYIPNNVLYVSADQDVLENQ